MWLLLLILVLVGAIGNKALLLWLKTHREKSSFHVHHSACAEIQDVSSWLLLLIWGTCSPNNFLMEFRFKNILLHSKMPFLLAVLPVSPKKPNKQKLLIQFVQSHFLCCSGFLDPWPLIFAVPYWVQSCLANWEAAKISQIMILPSWLLSSSFHSKPNFLFNWLASGRHGQGKAMGNLKTVSCVNKAGSYLIHRLLALAVSRHL